VGPGIPVGMGYFQTGATNVDHSQDKMVFHFSDAEDRSAYN